MKSNGFSVQACTRHHRHLTIVQSRQRGQNKILTFYVHSCIFSSRKINLATLANIRLVGGWVRYGQRTKQAHAWLTHCPNQMSGAQWGRIQASHFPPIRQTGQQTGRKLFVDKCPQAAMDQNKDPAFCLREMCWQLPCRNRAWYQAEYSPKVRSRSCANSGQGREQMSLEKQCHSMTPNKTINTGG